MHKNRSLIPRPVILVVSSDNSTTTRGHRSALFSAERDVPENTNLVATCQQELHFSTGNGQGWNWTVGTFYGAERSALLHAFLLPTCVLHTVVLLSENQVLMALPWI